MTSQSSILMKDVFPLDKEIQGLYNVEYAHEKFWLLLAKVELSKFRKISLEKVMKNE